MQLLWNQPSGNRFYLADVGQQTTIRILCENVIPLAVHVWLHISSSRDSFTLVKILEAAELTNNHEGSDREGKRESSVEDGSQGKRNWKSSGKGKATAQQWRQKGISRLRNNFKNKVCTRNKNGNIHMYSNSSVLSPPVRAPSLFRLHIFDGL